MTKPLAMAVAGLLLAACAGKDLTIVRECRCPLVDIDLPAPTPDRPAGPASDPANFGAL